MVVLVPTQPSWPADGGAERAVWEALREELPDEAVLLHGVRIHDDGGVEREIDLLVLWPGVGIAVIEVKGGFLTHDQDGWWQKDATGRRRLIDPVGQARQAKYALRRQLRLHRLPAADARLIHLAAFPFLYVPTDWQTLELPRELIIDRGDLERPTGASEQVWQAIKHHASGSGGFPAQAASDVVDLIARSLPASELQASVAAHEVRLEQFTNDQKRLLDLLQHQPSLHIRGVAGAGKTLLAVEQARRLRRAGKRVALLCYSRGLAAYLIHTTAAWRPDNRPDFVGMFHDFAEVWTGTSPPADQSDLAAVSRYYESQLPNALAEVAAAASMADKYDAIVVDEAQDFAAPWWQAVQNCLRGDAGLFLFSDDDQTLFDRANELPLALPPFELSENLRSTKQIAQCFGSLRSIGNLRALGSVGLPVRILNVPMSAAVEAADDIVEHLIDEGWLPEQIALLTTGSRHPDQRNTVDVVGYDEYWGDFLAGPDVFYGHVLGFKGLERSVIVLVVNGFREPDRARQMLYTGMSRAKSLLVLVGPRAEIETIGGEGLRRRLEKAVDCG